MTDNENEFEFEGKTYVAVDDKGSCKECSFYSDQELRSCLALSHLEIIPRCYPYARKDRRDVNFKEKQ
jgi:hypothetical protein